MRIRSIGFAVLAALAPIFVQHASGYILHDGTPGSGTTVWGYSPTAGGIDSNTTHLWHLQENSGSYVDSIAGVANLPLASSTASSRNAENILEEGTTVNRAVRIATSAPTAYNAGVNAGVYAKAPVNNSVNDNISTDQADSLWGANGAFTWEAIIQLDFPATTSLGPAANAMRIISAAGDNSTDSFPIHFLFMPKNDDPSYPAGLTEARLTLGINNPTTASTGVNYEEITAFVPTSGANAIADGAWYHVAATYDGAEGGANNVKLYWTRINGTTDTTTAANLLDPSGYLDGTLGAGNPKNSFLADPTRNGLTFDFAIGNRGGGTQTVGNFDGRMDEFRISTVARGAGDFLFRSAAHAGDFDGDGDVDGADFVAWQANFPKASGATPAEGDADADGDVDGADFVVWQANFPFTPASGAAPVPEPSAGWLAAMAALAGVMIVATHRRQRIVAVASH